MNIRPFIGVNTSTKLLITDSNSIISVVMLNEVTCTTCSENVCVPKALHVEHEILRKKSLLPFLQIRLIYAVNGLNKLNKSTNQRQRRRARRRSGRSHSATVEGEGEALRRLEGGPPALIDLSITRTLSLFLAMPRHPSVALALSRYPSLLLDPSRSFSVPLALSYHYAVPYTHARTHWP